MTDPSIFADARLKAMTRPFNGIDTPMNHLQPCGESLEECCERLSTTVTELRRERASIALILEMFRNAPLSISSVQPILELAERLNGPMVPR